MQRSQKAQLHEIAQIAYAQAIGIAESARGVGAVPKPYDVAQCVVTALENAVKDGELRIVTTKKGAQR